MSEESGKRDSGPRCEGWMKLYHPSGALITLPVPLCGDGQGPAYTYAFGAVQHALDAGFLVAAPGMEAGEQKEIVGYVVRRQVEDKEGITPVVDLYSADDGQNRYKFLKVYLNTDDDVTAFEKVAGINLSRMQKYIGTGDIERGKSRELDKLVYKVRPFSVIYKPHPKYDADAAKAAKPGEYMIPKKKFVRWGESKPMPATATEPQKPRDFTSDIAEWEKFLTTDPPLDMVSERVMEARNVTGLLAALKPVIEGWQERGGGIEWDKENKCFVAPYDPAATDDKLKDASGDEIPF